MVTPEKRMYDMLGLVSKLDISPSMYKDAVDKYKNIGEYLQEKGINADFYPQGSFSLGTVVRPYKNDEETNYDLDAICQINTPKDSTTPQAIKKVVEEAFEADERYKSRLKKYDKCCTIQYAETNLIGFSIDIVPAVDEDIYTKRLLKQRSPEPSYIDTSIAITDKKSGEYFWATNNPKGFKAWFDKINKPFLEHSPQQSRKTIFESYRGFFASIEEIPLELERSSLQRVIQILKRHRDVYFAKITNGDKLKPISAIITTIVAYITENVSVNMDIFDLLQYVLNELDIYSKHQILNEAQFSAKYINKNIIRRINGEWKIENPVNPEDNLADAWNEDPKLAVAFFNWVKCVSTDFLQSISKNDTEFVTMLEQSFGFAFVQKNFDKSKYTSSAIETKPINTSDHSKPWSI